jgi:D-glycero-D-manno-heptose 1,7-bisphosphate phosphatase
MRMPWSRRSWPPWSRVADVAQPGRRAVFVDRDGTIIREREYLADPENVELLPGAAHGLSLLHRAGFPIIIVTNQSGIARGYFTEEAYQAVQGDVVRKLARRGVPILDSYHCPHHPDFTGDCDCRKPATGLVERAAREHGLNLAASAFIGDRIRDVVAAHRFGGLAILVRTGYGEVEARHAPAWVHVADDLSEAAGTVLATSDSVDTAGEHR